MGLNTFSSISETLNVMGIINDNYSGELIVEGHMTTRTKSIVTLI